MIIGVTGGMGCGKSTVARMVEAAGFRRIDADAIVREQVLTDPTVKAALQARWGEEVLRPDGAVDRARVADKIFADETERRWLESLVHPRVFAAWREQLATDPAGRWVIEVPLLFEQRLENWFDFIVCVACAPEQQLTRLEQRGLPRPLAGQRITQQLPLAHKIEHSDFVLWNDGSTAFLQSQVDRLLAVVPTAA